MNTDQVRELYVSSNGDRWELGRDKNNKHVVIHTPNAKSGGAVSNIDIGNFLAASHYGPEHQALMAILQDGVEVE